MSRALAKDVSYVPIIGVRLSKGCIAVEGLGEPHQLRRKEFAVAEALALTLDLSAAWTRYSAAARYEEARPRQGDQHTFGGMCEVLMADRLMVCRLPSPVSAVSGLQRLFSREGLVLRRPSNKALARWALKKFVRVAFAHNVLRWGDVLKDVRGDANQLQPRHFEVLGGFLELETSQSDVPLPLSSLLARCFRTSQLPKLSYTGFMSVVGRLAARDLVTAPLRSVCWGHFEGLRALCPHYGYTRGTPVDRYYLDRFVRRIRPNVEGTVLEVGGKSWNVTEYGFDHCKQYLTVDLTSEPGVDVTGDVHDRRLFQRGTFHSILAFNVLEHCEKPWVVVENFRSWLRPRGRVFCVTPNMQRVHRDPVDFWRTQPDAYKSLFASYRRMELTTYGNLRTSIAALSGISAEELPAMCLDTADALYPVISCVIAEV